MVELSSDGGRLAVGGEADASGRVHRFDRGPRAMAEQAPDPLTLSVDPDTRATLGLGAAARPAASETVDANDAALVSEAPPACTPPDAGVRICLWRYPAAAPGSPAPDDRTRSGPRAGYAE
jgi:hypothetical protein